MPSVSQKQEKFFNFVHAVQSGEASAKGYSKVQQAAKSIKPSSVEHFMGRGHIDKNLPVKKAFDKGFIKAAINKGLTEGQAVDLLNLDNSRC